MGQRRNGYFKLKKALALSIALLLLSPLEASAGGRGGHNTNFDANLFGGNWTTINCNNTSADDTAWTSWISASVAANPAVANLHVTGTVCNLTFGRRLVQGISNYNIWSYGVTFGNVVLGAGDSGGSLSPVVLIQQVNIGDTTFTVKTLSDISNFSANGIVRLGGLDVQYADCGAPANFAFFENVVVTAVNSGTGVVTFSPPAKNQYLTTWPNFCGGNDGPASAQQFSCNDVQFGTAPPCPANVRNNTYWSSVGTMYGFTTNSQITAGGQSLNLVDFNSPVSFTPSNFGNMFASYGYIDTGEVDKLYTLMYFNHIQWRRIPVQSASGTIEFHNSRITNMDGTSTNTVLDNTIITGDVLVGPNGDGAGQSMTVKDSVLSTSHLGVFAQWVPISSPTWDSVGGFCLATTDPEISAWAHMLVPGQTYMFGNQNPFLKGTPETNFHVLTVFPSGSNYCVTTDLPHGSLPSPTCGGSACPLIVAYPYTSATQLNSGPADLTQFVP